MPKNVDLLLQPDAISEAEIRDVLAPIEFHDWQLAWARLDGLTRDPEGRAALTAALPMLLSALTDAATPDNSMLNLDRLVRKVDDPVTLLRFLAENPRAVEVLVKLFVNSQFFTEILLRNPEYLERLTSHKRLSEFKSRDDFREEATRATAAGSTFPEQLDALRRFQQWELMRIGACDSFGLLDFKSVTVQLSLLADSLVQSALDLVARKLQLDVSDFTVIALGKLGGEELNYSSDIDLVFVSADSAERYWEFGQRVIRAIMDTTAEGFLYRVDMRLRPWGQSGPLVSTAESYLDYLRKNSALWERQALLKARPIAGNLENGRALLKQAELLIFEGSIEEARANVLSMKQKIEAGLQRKGRTFGEIKSGKGSIRDIEFVTQFLQIKHGRSEPSIRSFNTLDGLVRLADRSLIQPGEYQQLSTAYKFLRTIEHALQLLHYRQAHSLPTDQRELSYLARRLDFPTSEAFLDNYQRHATAVRAIYHWYIESGESVGPVGSGPIRKRPKYASVMEAAYSRIFTESDMARHALLLDRLSTDNPIEIEVRPEQSSRIELTVCGFDEKGDLAMICGLFFAYGFNIAHGNVFTADQAFEARDASNPTSQRRPVRPTFVDVFTLEPPDGYDSTVWDAYRDELVELVQKSAAGRLREAQAAIARRVAVALRNTPPTPLTFLPVDISLNNEQSERFTVLNINTRDTPGFLYELSNSLSLLGFDIRRVVLTSIGDRAVDTLFVAGPDGKKITDDRRQARLRAAVVFVKHFMHLVPQSPNPEKALLHFGQFLEQLLERDDWGDELASLDRDRELKALTRLLGASDFLWEDFLRLQHDNLFPVLRDVEHLEERKSRQLLETELAGILADDADTSDWQSRLNAYKDREMFRVDMRHIGGQITEFGQFSDELSDVADVVVEGAFNACLHDLAEKRGEPLDRDGKPVPFAVFALGKAGGRELGFASDIELMFVYGSRSKTSESIELSCADFFVRHVENFAATIDARRKGVFEIDLRLRPYGNAGPLAVSLTAFESYFAPSGPAWPYERQALVKLRYVAGSKELDKQVTDLRDRFVYTGEPFDLSAMRAMRESQVRQLVQAGSWNAKLSPGGLVDCEYLVQGLQMSHGHADTLLRRTNSLSALNALRNGGFITEQDRATLGECYIFLRQLIDALRMVRGDARDLAVPDTGSDEFDYLARRLGYSTNPEELQAGIEAVAEKVTGLLRILDD